MTESDPLSPEGAPESELLRLLEWAQADEARRKRQVEWIRRFFSAVRITEREPVPFGVPLPPAVLRQEPDQRAIVTVPVLRW
jgi:hypothetical protein